MIMYTYSGIKFNLQNPNPDDIKVADIAHNLSMLCRFNGSCKKFYSVAEHAVRLSYLVPEDFALEALHHDDNEAYLGDIISSVKYLPGLEALLTYEVHIQSCINSIFHLPPVLSKEVDEADKRILMNELNDLLTNAHPLDNLKNIESFYNYKVDITLTPEAAETEYLRRHRELFQS